jgi:hypothetical protein
MKFAVVVLVLVFSASIAVQAADKKGVVIQMSDNDPAKWNLALNNANKVQEEFGKDKVDVEIVAYGPGINMLKFDSEVANRVTAAENGGIAIRACGNTMKAMKLTEKDLNSSVKVVPAGVIEIMTKQEAGWSYIRP